MISRLLGIIKARVITSVFGASLVADVINTSFYLPNNLRKLFAEGAMNIAFIPFLSKSNNKNERSKLLSLMLSFQIILFTIIILIFSFFGKQIFSLITDFNNEGTVLGGNLLPYFMGFLALISFSTILSSILQFEKRFLIFGIAPLFFNIILIIFISQFYSTFGPMVMAYGVVVSALIQLVFTLVSTIHLKYKIKFSILFDDKEFHKVLKLWTKVIVSNLAILASHQFSAYLATTLSTGSATAFSNSMIFFSAPFGIIFTGIVTVSYPEMALRFANKDEEGFKKSLSYAFDGMIYLFLPVTIALMGLSCETVAVVLQNGLFTFENTLMTAHILFHFIFGLLIVGLSGLMLRTAIARGLGTLVLKITIIQALLDSIMAFILVNNNVGVISLAISNNISSLFSLIVYMIILRSNIDFKSFFKVLFKTFLVNIPLLLIVLIYHFFKPLWYITGSNIRNLIIYIVIALCMAIVTLVMYYFTNIPIISLLKNKKDQF